MATVRSGLAAVVLLTLFAAAACSSGASSNADRPTANRPTAGRPNFVLIVTDDLAAGDLGAMPNLRALVTDEGVSFSDYFVSVSLCCPSRTSMLRGQYAHNTGVLTNEGVTGGFPVAYERGLEDSTLATWLQDAGYRTGLIGKYLNFYPQGAGATYLPPGWDEWASPVLGDSAAGFDYTLNENGRLIRYGDGRRDYVTDVYMRKTVDFVTGAARDDQPFFMWLGMEAPHAPATPAPEDADAFAGVRAPRTPSYDQADVSDMPAWVRELPPLSAAQRANDDRRYRLRLQSLQALDRQLTTLVDTLRENGQLDNTYLVVTSDNGFHLGQHRLSGGKQTAYEEDINLPLLVRGPNVPRGQTSDALVGNIDLAPTFAALAGAPAADFVDGRSFADQLHDPGANLERESFLLEHWQVDLGSSTAADGSAPSAAAATAIPTTGDAGFEGFGESPSPPEYRGVRTVRYTYVEYDTDEVELYDNIDDPDQLHNLAAIADQALLDRLSERVAALADCQADACRTAEDVEVPEP